MGNNNCQESYEFQTQLFMLDNRLELKTAQSHCFNVAGRMLCAAEHLSYLLKNKKIEKKKEIFGYYNSFKFADTKDIEELKSNMIEQMDNFARMKRKFKQKFKINLILPLNKDSLIKIFDFLKQGLDFKNKRLYESMLNLLLNNKKDDYQIEINNYYKSFDNLNNQKLKLDPNYLMEYYPEIEYNVTNLRNEVKKKFKENRDFKPKMIINERCLNFPLQEVFDENLEAQNSESIFKDDNKIDEEKDKNIPKDSIYVMNEEVFIDIFKE